MLPTLALAGGLAGCANVHERPADLGRIGLAPEDVLAIERADFDRLRLNGRPPRMIAVDAVENLRCVTLRRLDEATPRCDYRLRYRRLDGASATKARRNRYFARDHEGRWEHVIIV